MPPLCHPYATPLTPLPYLVGLVLGDGGQLLGRLGVRCGGAGARGAGQWTAVDVQWTCRGARPGVTAPWSSVLALSYIP